MKKLLIMLLLLGPVAIVAVADERGLPKSSENKYDTLVKDVAKADKECNDMILKIRYDRSPEQLYFIYQKCIETLLDNKSKENNNPKQ